MSRIFLSHSSANNAEAVALHDWLEDQGWKGEIFLDLDPERGIAAGERWERRLNEAANRCEAVLFLVSKAWLKSGWCRKELNLAHRLNKPLFGVLIEDMKVEDVPKDLSGDWQLVRLASGRDHIVLRAVLPVTHEEAHVTFSKEGLQRLKHGLEKAGLDPKYFPWPPTDDPDRPPYRGLRHFEADDTGIFFGRDGPIVEAMDTLRGLREAAPPRLLVILGASGAGKSSFLRAGLWKRLEREDRHFLPLPVIRPKRAVLTGVAGLIASLEVALEDAGLGLTRAKIRAAVASGASGLAPLLETLVAKKTPVMSADKSTNAKPPILIIPIDQAEELFLVDGAKEAQALLELLHELSSRDKPPIIVLFTIRSDSYDRLQNEPLLTGLKPFDLSPMPQGSYTDVIMGPARRLNGTDRPLKIEDPLVNALLSDIEEGGAKDALPLLAFTLEWLYREHGGDGDLKLSEYEELGRVKGSIEAAVARVLEAAEAYPDLPRGRDELLALLRRTLIPRLASVDRQTGTPRRRVANLSDIGAEARPLIDLLIDQHLLSKDIDSETREKTVEPAHEALLRHWGQLRAWLRADTGLLGVLEGVQLAAADWDKKDRTEAWLTHSGARLAEAKGLRARPDLTPELDGLPATYLAACHMAESAAKWRTRRTKLFLGMLFISVVAGLGYAGWLQRENVTIQFHARIYEPIRLLPVFWDVTRTPLAVAVERDPKRGHPFSECPNCPEMVVVPGGEFLMGSPRSDLDRSEHEDDTSGEGGNQVRVTIPAPFAVSKFEVTFDQWDACVAHGGCTYTPGDQLGWGRGRRPVNNVSWEDITAQYLPWLTKVTGKKYRLLSEAEWEYAARGITDLSQPHTRYFWGDKIGKGNANCSECGSEWDGNRTAPVDTKAFKPNNFGLHQMHGNVWEWVEDCYQNSYHNAPKDGTTVTFENCHARVLRGGSWFNNPGILRSASRNWDLTDDRDINRGFRVGRTLTP